MSTREKFDILLVDDDPMMVRVLSRILAEFAPLRFATSGKDALRLAQQVIPDLILLDIEMPDMSGLDVCKALRRDALLQGVPVVFLTAHSERQLAADALPFGAIDFISKPPHPQLLLSRVHGFQRMKSMSDTLRGVSSIDFLTGAVTRRELKRSLAVEWQRAQRNSSPLALLLTCIENLGAYNDRYGEPQGDACLKSVADLLRGVVHRPADILARYAGGTFALLLPETELAGAYHVARQALIAIEGAQLSSADTGSNLLTLSMGASCNYVPQSIVAPPIAAPAEHSTEVRVLQAAGPDEMMSAAEQALCAARRTAGRQITFQTVAPAALPIAVAMG